MSLVEQAASGAIATRPHQQGWRDIQAAARYNSPAPGGQPAQRTEISEEMAMRIQTKLAANPDMSLTELYELIGGEGPLYYSGKYLPRPSSVEAVTKYRYRAGEVDPTVENILTGFTHKYRRAVPEFFEGGGERLSARTGEMETLVQSPGISKLLQKRFVDSPVLEGAA